MNILYTILLIALGSICYRLGGLGYDGWKRYPWIPRWLCHTETRDIGTPLCGIGIVLLFKSFPWYLGVIWFILANLSMRTYWDDEFGGVDNFYAHGGVAGLSAIVLCFSDFTWYGVLAGALACGIGMGVWCRVFSNDNVEEFGRGAIYCITRLLLLI